DRRRHGQHDRTRRDHRPPAAAGGPRPAAPRPLRRRQRRGARRDRGGDRAAVAGLQGDGGGAAARAADPALLAAGEVRRGPRRRGPAVQHRAGRPRLVRHLRAHRRHPEVRPRPRDQVRDLRHQPDQGRHHRRAALDRLDPAVGALQGPRGREGLRRPGGAAAPLAHRAGGRGRDGHRPRGPARDLQPGQLRQRRRAGRAAHPWWRREGRHPLAGRHPRGHQGRGPRPGLRDRGDQAPARQGDQHAARAREDRRHPLLLRGADPGRDRTGARRHREPDLPDAHQGGAAAARQAVRDRL
ncbi:MAG: RNA polymerase sigma factor, partial [uncultured Frankineae bacterium]